ncbi:AraC family transcriptional regulator ligand-binding domain-containing protein [Hypericibacter sp.]|uniref:helix-turn-helix transcriptional regulator n=1 Tax=Hypericibacter sp. TaxID=2705401 RepID=UPI003D6CAA2E
MAHAHRAGAKGPIPIVQARTLECLAECLKGTDLKFDELRAQFGMPDVRLDRDDSFVPLREALMVEEEISKATGDAYLGLHLAERSGLGALGHHGRYVCAAATLGEAINRADSHVGDHILGARMWLMRAGPNVLWCYGLTPSVVVGRQHSNLFSLLLMRDLVRLATGKAWMPDEILLEGPPQRNQQDLNRAFGCPITWNASMTALAFPRQLLARPLLQRAEAQGESLPGFHNTPSPHHPSEFVHSLRCLVKSLLPAGPLDLSLLTRLSGLPARTLQRELGALGLSFSTLLDQGRLELALELMRSPSHSLIDVGLELGYSDPANFTRAFKRWTGVAPGVYRRVGLKVPDKAEVARAAAAAE